MLTRLVLGLSMLLAVPAAQAASFDCAKAASAFERAICADPELSAADETLAKAYATAIGGLSEPARAAVQKGQRSWLSYAERACTDDARPLQGDYDEEGRACLRQLIDNRVGRLEVSRMQSGRRFYPVDFYAVGVDPQAEAESWNKVTTKEFSSLRLDAADEEAEAFNAFMEDHDAAVHRAADSGDAEFDPASDSSTDVSLTIGVDSVSSRRISLVVNDWWYGHGAAHGNYTISYLHFLTDAQRELVAADIFAGDGWADALSELVVAELNRTIDGGIWPDSAETVREVVVNPSRWSFAEEGLIVQLQPYEVTAYAYGPPTATIPWDALDGFMAEDGLAIATY